MQKLWTNMGSVAMSSLLLLAGACIGAPLPPPRDQTTTAGDSTTAESMVSTTETTIDPDATTIDPDATTSDPDTTTSDPDTTTSGSDSSSGTPVGVSHDEYIQPIWDEHCVEGCHEPGGEWGMFLDLSGDAHDDIVDVPAPELMRMDLVEPGDFDHSYLWHKINGTQVSVGGSGLDMPKARPGEVATILSQEEYDLIGEWIVGGAAE